MFMNSWAVKKDPDLFHFYGKWSLILREGSLIIVFKISDREDLEILNGDMETFPWRFHEDIKIFMKIFCWIIKKHYYFFFIWKKSKDNEDTISKFYLISCNASWWFFSCLFRLYLFLHKLLKVSFGDQSFYLFLVHGTLRCRVHNHGKRDETYWVPCIWITCHWRRVLHEVFFPLWRPKPQLMWWWEVW